MISNIPEVLTFNQLFVKLNRFSLFIAKEKKTLYDHIS